MSRKILYFLDFPCWVGGSNKVLLTQAYIMSQRGYDTAVVIPSDEKGNHASEFDEICKNYGLRTIEADFPVTVCMEGIDIKAVMEHYDVVLNLLKKEEADFIHSVQLNVTAELASRELDIPHLMNIYPTDLDAFNLNWMDIYPCYHSADSEFFSKRWSDGLHIPSACIRVAYKGKCKRINQETDGFPLRILSIGVLIEQKNQLELIKFMLICKKNKIHVSLTILGNDNTSYGEACKDFVKQNGLEGEVIFQGFVINIEDYFAQADLMILASTVESYPGVIVESMANRVPVLSTPVAGVPELLKDGYNGFLTDGFESQDIYNAFKRYLSHKDVRLHLKDHAYETYQKYHSYEAVGDNLDSYYNWILQDYRKKSRTMSIKKVEEIFQKFIKEKFINEKSCFTQRNIWFLYHLYKNIDWKNINKTAIWGAGTLGKTALEWIEILGCRNSFIGFLDTYKKGEYLGYPVWKPEKHVLEQCDKIFLAIADTRKCLEVIRCLEQGGKKRNRDYFMLMNAQIRI